MKQKTKDRLEELYLQKQKIEDEIKLLEENLLKETPSKELTKNEKIELFKALFINREDIFAKKWVSKDGSKQGFYPVTKTFKGSDFLPITNQDIEQHLRGKIQLSSYLIDKENKSKYIIIEITQKDIDRLMQSFKQTKTKENTNKGWKKATTKKTKKEKKTK